MHVILTGATGLVGSGALAQLIVQLQTSGSRVSKVSVLSRRPVPMAEGQKDVNVIVHNDFGTYPPELLRQLEGAEACIWALGISQTQVSKEEYVKITVDYPLAAAKAFAGLSDPFKFVYVSGEGATQTPGFLTAFFGRIKGQAESALLNLQKTSHPSLRPYSVRPAFVDKAMHPAVVEALQSRSSSINDRLAKVLGPPLRAFYPSYVSPTQELGDFLVKLATSDGEPLSVEKGDVLGEGRIVPNKAARRIMSEEKGK